MKNGSGKNNFTIVCLLVTGFSATPALATWYVNQSEEGYYKPQEYHNERFGDFPPADIDQKLFGHLNTKNETEEIKPQTDDASLSSNINQPVSTSNQQVLNPVQNYSQQNLQQPAFGSYKQRRKFTSPGMQRHIQNRNKHLSELRNRRSRSNFNSPWNNRGSSFSGPWNNNGSSVNMPWGNNNGSGFSGPWNNRGSSNSGPWDNNGSSFSMPWGNNNNGSSFSPFGNGGGWSW